MLKKGNISHTDNTRIAKNTVFLYIRTFVTLLVSLYTSRIVLSALGFEDFGIWSVVGGIVAMFLFIKESLSAAVGRFLTFAIGKGDQEEINKAFSSSFLIHFLFAIIIVLLSESIGTWFLTEKLVIPSEKMNVARWVFHISVCSSFVTILTIPYHSLLISYERMNVYAYMGLWDAFVKLLVAFSVTLIDRNRLIVYGILLLASTIITAVFIILYVHKTFSKIHFHATWDKQLYRSIFAFSGWSLLGNISYMAYTQGLNMVINMFFGPVVNAARAVSLQIEQSVRTFVINFQAAINPQIIKNCAIEDWEAMHLLMFRSSKFSAYLLFILALPIVLEIEMILHLWLSDVPEHTATFCRIMFAVILLETMANSIMIGVSAKGDIKKYQILVSTILLTIVPFSYVCLSFGMGPESVFIVYFIVEIFACLARIWVAKEKIHLSLRKYARSVVFVVSSVMLLSSVMPLMLHVFMEQGLLRFLLVLFVGFISTCINIYCFGLDSSEKTFLYTKIVCRIVH